MEPKTKQSLLVTVVGVTLFVALLRLSDVLAFAAKLIDLVLPILAGGILALFINVPMTGLEKRLNRLFGKAKKQPSAKAIHLLSFFITLLGVVLVLVLAVFSVTSFGNIFLQGKYMCGLLSALLVVSIMLNVSYQYSYEKDYLSEFAAEEESLDKLESNVIEWILFFFSEFAKYPITKFHKKAIKRITTNM